jgi:hypothetical protein
MTPIAEKGRSLRYRYLFLPPPLIIFFFVTLILWLSNLRKFISDDSYFYLVTARNMALHGKISFSGIIATNGVHPAWQALLGGIAWILSALDSRLLATPLPFIAFSAALLYGGLVNIYRSAESLNLDNHAAALVSMIYLSLFGLLMSEAHLYFFLLSWLLRSALIGNSSSRWHPFGLGILSGLVFLSRLDSIFFLIPFYVWYLIQRRSISKFLILILTSALIAAPYLWANLHFFGSMVPVSGWIKSSFPGIYLGGLHLSGSSSALFGYNIILGIVPMVISTSIIFFDLKTISKSENSIIIVLALGAVLHFLYVVLFTRDFTLWAWYYVLPIMALSFSAAKFQSLLKDRIRKPALIGIYMIAIFGVIYKSPWTHGRQDVTTRTEAIMQLLNRSEVNLAVILVSDWSGEIAYNMPRNRVIPADMLTANRRFFDTMISSGNALEFIFEFADERVRGIDYVLYSGGEWLTPDSAREQLTYINPKLFPPERQVIGQMYVGEPADSLLVGPGDALLLWKIEKPKFL